MSLIATDIPPPAELLAKLDNLIAQDKSEIIGQTRREIRTLIENRSRVDCLTLVSRSHSGRSVRTYSPTDPVSYAPALIAFVRKKEYEGYHLDSALSEPVSEKVTDIFSQRIENKTDDIVEAILPYIVKNERFLEGLRDAIKDSYQGVIPAYLSTQVSNLLMAKLKTAVSSQIDTNAIAAMKAATVKAIAATITPSLAAKLMYLMIKVFSTTLKPLIAKLLASAALKAAIASKIKVVVAAAFLGGFIKFLGAKIGLSAGASVMWFLIPIAIAWIAYETAQFPAKLGEKVSESIAHDLENRFPNIARTLSESIANTAFQQAISVIVGQIVNDDIVKDMMDEILADAKA